MALKVSAQSLGTHTVDCLMATSAEQVNSEVQKPQFQSVICMWITTHTCTHFGRCIHTSTHRKWGAWKALVAVSLSCSDMPLPPSASLHFLPRSLSLHEVAASACIFQCCAPMNNFVNIKIAAALAPFPRSTVPCPALLRLALYAYACTCVCL